MPDGGRALLPARGGSVDPPTFSKSERPASSAVVSMRGCHYATSWCIFRLSQLECPSCPGAYAAENNPTGDNALKKAWPSNAAGRCRLTGEERRHSMKIVIIGGTGLI